MSASTHTSASDSKHDAVRSEQHAFDPLSIIGSRDDRLAAPATPAPTAPFAGTRVKTLKGLSKNVSFGMAVDKSGCLMAVSSADVGEVAVYALPSGRHLRTFGRNGSGPGQFDTPALLCFTPAGNLLVAEFGSGEAGLRIQEVTIEGEYVRFFGVGVFEGSHGVWGVDCNEDHVVATQPYHDTQQVRVFDYRTGECIGGFGVLGQARGQLQHSTGVRIAPDRKHVAVANSHRISLYTLSGQFVDDVIVGKAGVSGFRDLCYSPGGEVAVCDGATSEVLVFGSDYSRKLRPFIAFIPREVKSVEGRVTTASPGCVCFAAGKLYVMDSQSGRVTIFE